MKKEIYFAGGCFWGVEKYFSYIEGVIETKVGYANGSTEFPTYEEVCTKNTGHAETVKVTYDDNKVFLMYLTDMFFQIIDPVSVNRQGGDVGAQYRTGIYYRDKEEKAMLLSMKEKYQRKYKEPIAVEIKELENFYPGEEYHQHYLDKNPGGYCHISRELFEKAKKGLMFPYIKKEREELKERLTSLQYEVTQNRGTEPPFQNSYNKLFEEGIYVDVTTGEPLFLSTDKFESGCGWPAFAKPISPSLLVEKEDRSHSMIRTEVRSKIGDSHLGHVFEDGPLKRGGLRYCMNSAALLFIPIKDMEEKGYGEYKCLLENKEEINGGKIL